MSEDKKSGSGIDLDNCEFRTALSLIESTRHSVFLTGKAGTGKSTFLRYITETTSKKHVVLAPTGIAAVNVGGQTLHSFFHLPFKPLLPDDPDFATPKRLFSVLKLNSARLQLIRELELIIIDEISMVRADMIDFVDKILRFATGNRRQPFGGKQLLFVGDIFQLEPVVTPDMKEILKRWYKTTYFFNARVFDEMKLVSVELTKVYRQTDRSFVELLDRIRLGVPTVDDIHALNARLAPADDRYDGSEMSMTIATRRDMVDHINEEHLSELKTPLRTYIGSVTGEFPEASYPTDLELTLKEGAQVVFVKNDAGSVRRWVNGTLGRVVEATDDEVRVCLEDGSEYTVEPERWGNIRFKWDKESHRVIEEEIGSFTQYPLKLAWALTIHKSQGLTFNRINVDVGRGAFTGGQSYVALSRCRSLEGISLKSTLNERDIFVNPTVVHFSRTYNDASAVDSAIRSAQADGLYHDATEAFGKGDYRRAARLLCWASGLRNDLADNAVGRLVASKVGRLVDDYEQRCLDLRAENADLTLRLRHLADEYVERADRLRADWDVENALCNYDKALHILPGYVEACLGKAQALFAMSDADGAIALLNQASDSDLHDYRPPYELGRFFQSCEDYTNALNCFLKALERNDRVALIHDSLADLYDAVDDLRLAKRHRKAAAKLRSSVKKNGSNC